MIVLLPNESKGGELTVKHKNTEKTMNAKSGFSHHYVAFFSECDVKMAPITSGYRVSLIYDLDVVNLGTRTLPRAPAVVSPLLVGLLRLWRGSPTGKV